MKEKQVLDKKLYILEDKYKDLGFDSYLMRINPDLQPLEFGNQTISNNDIEGTNQVLQEFQTSSLESLTPKSDSLYNNGSSTVYWLGTYTDAAYFNSTASISGATPGVMTTTGKFVPSINNKDDIGSDSAGYKNIYFEGDLVHQGNTILANDGKMGFYGVTPVARQTELTDELTTITHTAPGTPDYAIQDLTDTGGFGFKTKDEGNSVLAVIANLQTRVKELEDKLTAYGLLTDAD